MTIIKRLILAISVILLVSCRTTQQDPIIGSWTRTISDSPTNPLKSTLSINEDNSFDLIVEGLPGKYTKCYGTWVKYDGYFGMTLLEINVNGKEYPDTPQEGKSKIIKLTEQELVLYTEQTGVKEKYIKEQ